MKSAREIREMLKESGKNVYIRFGGGDISYRVYGVRSKTINSDYKTTQVKCLLHNNLKFFSICSTDEIYCQ